MNLVTILSCMIFISSTMICVYGSEEEKFINENAPLNTDNTIKEDSCYYSDVPSKNDVLVPLKTLNNNGISLEMIKLNEPLLDEATKKQEAEQLKKRTENFESLKAHGITCITLVYAHLFAIVISCSYFARPQWYGVFSNGQEGEFWWHIFTKRCIDGFGHWTWCYDQSEGELNFHVDEDYEWMCPNRFWMIFISDFLAKAQPISTIMLWMISWFNFKYFQILYFDQSLLKSWKKIIGYLSSLALIGVSIVGDGYHGKFMIYKNPLTHSIFAFTFFGLLIFIQCSQLLDAYRRNQNVEYLVDKMKFLFKNYRFWSFFCSMVCVSGLLLGKVGFEWILLAGSPSVYLEPFTNGTKKSIGKIRKFFNLKNSMFFSIYWMLFIMIIAFPGAVVDLLNQLQIWEYRPRPSGEYAYQEYSNLV